MASQISTHSKFLDDILKRYSSRRLQYAIRMEILPPPEMLPKAIKNKKLIEKIQQQLN